MTSREKKLSVGQVVNVDELAWGFCFSDPSPELPRYVVMAVEPEYFVLGTEPAGTTLRIPAYLVKLANLQDQEALEAA